MNLGNSLIFKEIDGERTLCVSYSQIEEFQNCPLRWFYDYIEGKRTFEKTEATAYGSAVHETLEYFFKNRYQPNEGDMSKAFNYYAEKQEIPFTSPKNQIIAMQHAGQLIEWIVGLFKVSPVSRQFVRPVSELNPFEKMLRYSKPIGIEEEFRLWYKLPQPLVVDGKTYNKICINGFIDLHLLFENSKMSAHYVVDWKSGAHVFHQKKLDENLQFPIYASAIYRKYGTFPENGTYLFTRTREYQRVVTDMARIKNSVEIMNDVFSKMYDFSNVSLTKFKAHVYHENKGWWGEQAAKLTQPVLACQEPKPSKLCFWCKYGRHQQNTCPYSSQYNHLTDKKS